MTRILLVEDDDMLAAGLRFALEKEQLAVDRASTVWEAEALYSKALNASRAYDLLLLDVMLPDGNGFELCRSVRERSTVPVLFLTACDEEVNVVQGLDLGGDDYITKPFRVKELISRIKANLRRLEKSTEEAGMMSANASASVIISGPLAAYPLETKVLKNGEPIELTPIELKLLLLFMRHPGQTLTREQLLAKLWDEQGEFVDDNTLSVYIRRLREKLEDNPSAPVFIVTVRGVGYKWDQRSDPHA